MSDFDFSEDEVDYDELYYNDDFEFIDRRINLNEKPKYRRIEKHKKCSEPDCQNNAYYHTGGSNNFYCGLHKTEQMYNPRRKICTNENCLKPAYYAIEGQKAIKCSMHKEQNMINLAKKMCTHDNCKKFPSYNFLQVEDRYCGDKCKEHKLDGMVDVKNPRCKFDGCNLFARFHKKTRCYTHKNS